VLRREVGIEKALEKGATIANNLYHEGEFTDQSLEFQKGTDFLERKSLKMSRIEATLLGEAKTVMATKSRTRPRNLIDWEGQMTLEVLPGHREGRGP
jgi:hypothetical protein